MFSEVFLFLAPGTDPAADRVLLEHGDSQSLLVWVPDVRAAVDVADTEVAGGARLVQLFRGFDLRGTAAVAERVGTRAAVGAALSESGGVARSVAIYHNPAADPAEARVVREHGSGWTAVVGAPEDQMGAVAREFAERGANVVEICGGTPLTVAARIDTSAPVRLVTWPFEAIDPAHAFKADYLKFLSAK